MKSTEEVKKELFRRREEYDAKRRKRSNATAAAGTVFAAVFLLTAVIIAPGFLKRPGGSPAETGSATDTGTESGETHSFIAGIVTLPQEIGDVLAGKCIDPLDSSLSVGDVVYVPLDYKDGGAEVNDRIRVTYTGNVAESYPLQMNILSIEYLGKCEDIEYTPEEFLDYAPGNRLFSGFCYFYLYSGVYPPVWLTKPVSDDLLPANVSVSKELYEEIQDYRANPDKYVNTVFILSLSVMTDAEDVTEKDIAEKTHDFVIAESIPHCSGYAEGRICTIPYATDRVFYNCVIMTPEQLVSFFETEQTVSISLGLADASILQAAGAPIY